MKSHNFLKLIAVYAILMFSSCSRQTQSVQENPNVYQEQSGFVDTHGVLIHYSIVGQGKPLVILYGGSGTSRDYYLPHLISLARSRRLIFLDQRGSGLSEKPDNSSGYSAKAVAMDVEAVRTALGLGKVDLLGHSSGGILALAYATKYPDNLQHLVLCSTAHSTAMMGAVYGTMNKKIPLDYRNLPPFDSAPVINGLNVPTLITVGEQDQCDLKLADMIHGSIHGSQLMIFPKTGHMTFADNPKLFSSTVNNFLR